MSLWKKYVVIVCWVCFVTMGSILVFAEEFRAEENVEFEIQEDELLQYKGSGGAVMIPEGITAIGDGAFQDCTVLTSIEMPDSVVRIGENAFSGCISLVDAKIPGSVNQIGKRAFFGCASLIKAEIPGSVKEIGDGAFSRCISMTELILGDGIEKIGEHTFNIYEMYSLDGAFSDCSSLQVVELPDSIREAGLKTFQNCTGLKQVKLSKRMYDVGISAFEGCTSLEQIDIPENIKDIYGKAFSGCSRLEHISFPASLDSIGANAFSGTKWMADRLKENPLVVVRGILINGLKAAGSTKIPEDVSEITETAFFGNKELVEVEIPENVKRIGWEAFSHCTNLKKIKFTKGLECIVEYAFTECDSLMDVELPEGMLYLSHGAFAGCDSLKSAKIPGSVRCVGGGRGSSWIGVFQGCRNLEYVSISEGTEDIDSLAFYECPRLSRVEIPSSVNGIGMNAFGECGNLTIWGNEGSYAQTFAAENGIPFRILGSDKGTVRFDANGGEMPGADNLEVMENRKYGKLPDAARKGYLFEGWYTAKTGGDQITEESIVKLPWEPVLYAHWSKISVKRVSLQKLTNPRGKKMKLKWKKVAEADGYQIRYAANKKIKKPNTKTTAKQTLTVKKLKKGKTYYVKVRAYRIDSAGKRVYGAYSKVRKVKIKK